MKIKKAIASIILVSLIMQVIITVIPEGALAVENTEEQNKEESQEVEIGREYEIKEEETWDVSKNQDGSVMAKWTLEDRTLVISGNGEMRDWYDENIDWHNNQYTDVIKNVIVEDGVTSIGEGAFAGCRGLVKIKIPERITSIKRGIFYECRSLTNIAIPKGVTSIGSEAFSGCSSLTSIEIPNSVTSIGEGAFAGCRGLVKIKIPERITSIKGGMFYECRSLTNIEIPEGVTSIGYRAFSRCSSLTSIEIPNSVTSIGGSAFRECSSLVNIEIPEGITKLEDSMFFGCDRLTSIKIPKEVTIIGEQAFYECRSLTNIEIPEGVTSIGYEAFEGCSSLTNINVNINNKKYINENGILFNKEKTNLICYPEGKKDLQNYIISDKVTTIENGAFARCSSLKKIQISENVKNIEGDVFSGCTKLILNVKADSVAHQYAEKNRNSYTLEGNAKEVATNYVMKDEEIWDVSKKQDGSVAAKWTLENRTLVISGNGEMKDWEYNDKNIDWHNSQYTKIIENVIIKEGVTRVGEYVFSGCSSLTNIKIPEGVTSIGSDAFYGCRSLANIEIPEGVTSIEQSTFYGCSSLINIKIPEGVTSIGSDAFYGCRSLANIEIPEGVTSIEQSAFYGCSSLVNIKIPERATRIGDLAFYRCSSLTNIEIPKEVTFIGNGVFSSCSNLENINVSVNNKDYISENGILFNKEKTELICYPAGKKHLKYIIPEGVTNIGYEAFYGCSSLVNIKIPERATRIGDLAFYRCSSLTNIEIPESVTSIGYGAFEDCNSLTNIIIPKRVMSIEDRAFYGINDITVKGNTEGHRYAEKNKVGYIIDEEGPQITYTPNGVTQPKKEHQIQVNIEDKKSGVREESLKYQWTQNTEEPNKESFIEKIENEKIITKRDIDGIWYLWVYAKDKVGNETIKRSEGYNFLNIGDIDGNKKIDITDIMILKRHIISGSKEDWKITGEKLQKADINQNENIDITDLIILKKEVVKQ